MAAKYNPWNSGNLSVDPHKAQLYNNKYYAYQLSTNNIGIKQIFSTAGLIVNRTRPNINDLRLSNVQCFYCADYGLSDQRYSKDDGLNTNNGLTLIPHPRDPVYDIENIGFRGWSSDGIKGVYKVLDDKIKNLNDKDTTYAFMCYQYLTSQKYRLSTLENGTEDCYPSGQNKYPTGPYVYSTSKLAPAYDFIRIVSSYGSTFTEKLTYISLSSNCTVYDNTGSKTYPRPRTDFEPSRPARLSGPSSGDIIASEYLTLLSSEISEEAKRRGRNYDTDLSKYLDKYGQQNDITDHEILKLLNNLIYKLYNASKSGMHYDYTLSNITAILPISGNSIVFKNNNLGTNSIISAANTLSILIQNLEYLRQDCVCYSNCGQYAVCYCFGNKVGNALCKVNSVLQENTSPYN